MSYSKCYSIKYNRETGSVNGLNSLYYLNFLLEKSPNIDCENMGELDQLLSWSDSIPDDCKIPHKN